MQKLLTKLRFPVIVGSFVLFTWYGTKHYKEIFEDKLAAKRKSIDDSQDQKQDPKALAKLNEMKGNTWER